MSKKDAFFLLVILALAGGWGWSHFQRTRPSLPSPPTAHGSAAVSGGPICREHHIPEAKCGFCRPELKETLGFCKGHGVPEVFCYQCDPDLIPAFKAAGDWCAEHSVPESQCKLCRGSGASPGPGAGAPVPPSGGTPGARSQAPLRLPEIEVRRAAPGPDTPRHRLPPVPGCPTHELRVRFRDPSIEAKAGLETATLGRGRLAANLIADATLSFDRNRYAHVSARSPGIVATVRVDVGDRIEAGAVLATVDSQELGTAKATLLQAQAGEELWRRNRDREADLKRQGIAPERDLLEAETRLTEARIARTGAEQRLRNLGLVDEALRKIVQDRDTSSLLPVVSPFAGEVVARHAVLGEVVDTAHPLFEVTDPTTLWVLVDLPGEGLGPTGIGAAVTFDFDGLPGRFFPSSLEWISRALDPATRTLRARARLENPDGILRAEMYGRARIDLGRDDAILVPEASVQWDGTCNTVFVRLKPGVYEPRRVWLGAAAGGMHEVRQGLSPGEVVVTTGSYLLKTEILKGSIGAGCCEVEGDRS